MGTPADRSEAMGAREHRGIAGWRFGARENLALWYARPTHKASVRMGLMWGLGMQPPNLNGSPGQPKPFMGPNDGWQLELVPSVWAPFVDRVS